MMADTPLYATLLYDVRKELDISISEYFYLDMVHKLSYDRWCSKSLENCASDMGITKRGLIKLRDRLLASGLLKKNAKGHLKVTQKYTGVAVNKVPKPVNFVHHRGEQSSKITGSQNNNRKTIEKRGNKDKGSEAQKPGFVEPSESHSDGRKRDYRGLPSPAKEKLRERFTVRQTGTQPQPQPPRYSKPTKSLVEVNLVSSG